MYIRTKQEKNVEFEKVKVDTCWSLFFSINKKFNFAIDEAETIDERKIARNLKKKKFDRTLSRINFCMHFNL